MYTYLYTLSVKQKQKTISIQLFSGTDISNVEGSKMPTALNSPT